MTDQLTKLAEEAAESLVESFAREIGDIAGRHGDDWNVVISWMVDKHELPWHKIIEERLRPVLESTIQRAVELERERYKELILVGTKMSNVCFNGNQTDRIPQDYRQFMSTLQKEWDAALSELRKGKQ